METFKAIGFVTIMTLFAPLSSTGIICYTAWMMFVNNTFFKFE